MSLLRSRSSSLLLIFCRSLHTASAPPVRPLRFAVVGFGTAGQSLLIQLKLALERVCSPSLPPVHFDVFEQASSIRPVGAGFLLQPTGRGVLNRMEHTNTGPSPHALSVAAALESKAQRIDSLIGYSVDSSGSQRTVMNMNYSDWKSDEFGLGVARSTLCDALKEIDRRTDERILSRSPLYTVNYHFNRRVIASSSPSDQRLQNGVILVSKCNEETHTHILPDRHSVPQPSSIGRFSVERCLSHGPYDLVFSCDGTHSPLREHFMSHSHLTANSAIYPYGAIFSLIPQSNWKYPNQLHQRYFYAREMIGILPVGQDHQGQRSLTFFWSLSPKHIERFHQSPKELITAMKERIQHLFPEFAEFAKSHSLLDDPSAYSLARYRDVELERMRVERVCFLGDSAHGMSPQLGQGVNMALLDTEAMGNALMQLWLEKAKSAPASATSAVSSRFSLDDSDLSRLERSWSAQRHSHYSIYRLMSRALTPVFQSDYDWLARLRDWFFLPLSKEPIIGKKQSIKILTGNKQSIID